MPGSALYGAVIGIVFLMQLRVAPQPAGSMVYWLLTAIQLASGSVVCWRRTGLPRATAAFAINSATAAGLAVLAALGRVFPDVPPQYLLLMALSVFSGLGLFFAESRVNRDKWARWSQPAARQRASDIVTVRHIPDLRATRRS